MPMSRTVNAAYGQLQPLTRRSLFRRMIRTANAIAEQRGAPGDQADIRAMRQICHQRGYEVCHLYCNAAIRMAVHVGMDRVAWGVVFVFLENLAKQEMANLLRNDGLSNGAIEALIGPVLPEGMGA